MRLGKALAITAAMLMLLLLAGCKTSWIVDFTKAVDADLAEWGGYTTWDLNNPAGSGLTVNGEFIMTPIGFPADFTLTLWMRMDISQLNNADFRIWIGDEESDSPEHYIECVFSQVGQELTDEVLIHEDGAGLEYRDIDTLSPIPGIKKGDNVFKLDRRGDRIKITLNNSLLADFNAIYFNPAACFVGFVTFSTSDVDVYYRRIRVDYEGDAVGLP